MATKRIETQLTIKAVDQYSGPLRNMRTVTGRFADGVRTEMSRLQGMRGPLKLIEDYKAAQSTFGKSEAALRRARQKVADLRREMRSTSSPTKKMVRDFESAKVVAERLRLAHGKNKRELGLLRGKLRQAGVNTGDLAGEQRRRAGALDSATTAFGRQMDRMRRLETMQTRIADARKRMDRSLATAANLSFVGNASMMTGRRIMTALSGPVQQAIEFESAMSDVRKVVDFDTPEAYAQMSDDILDLSTRIPMAADGLAQIVAAGGQSGIAREELTRFAEMAAKIGVAFDISADFAGTSMASIKTAMGLTLDETGLLFDAMNHLSNNSAARADQTLDFMNRAGASGASFGFDNSETLAIGAAMIAAGAGADTAATSFRNMGRALTRGASATKRQSGAMKILGLDAEQVARDMQGDAVGTTADVLKRLRELPKHMQASVMSDLFGDEARELTKLINNAELLPQILSMVAEERQYLGSAEAEYAARAETTANNLQLTRNHLALLGISIGEVVLPPLNDLLEMSQGVIDRMVTWTKEHPKLTKWLVIGAAAVGGMAIAGGALLNAAAGLIGTMAVLRFGLVGLGARAVFAGGGIASLAGRFGMLRRLPRFRLASLVTPLRWAAGLVPSIRWPLLAGRLRWSSLIRPLSWLGRGALRFIPVIGWAALAGELAWHLLVKPLGWDKYLNRDALRGYLDEVKAWFSWDFIEVLDLGDFWRWPEVPPIFRRIFGLEEVPPIEGMDGLPDRERHAAEVVVSMSDDDVALPTPERIADLRAEVVAYREEVEAAKAALDAAPEFGNGITNPLRVQAQGDLDAAEAGLRRAEDRLKSAETASVQLTEALQVLNGTDVAPEINTESIDRAMAKVQQLAAGIRALPSSGAGDVPAPKPAGARAGGGPVRMGLPYLVNENTPRSEWFVPSRSGGVLNVGQAQAAFRSHLSAVTSRPAGRNPNLSRLHRGAQGLRAASLAVLTSSALAAPAVAQPAQAAKPGSGPVTVQIENFTVHVPSGVSDPDAIADLVADRLGQRVAATMSASFSD